MGPRQRNRKSKQNAGRIQGNPIFIRNCSGSDALDQAMMPRIEQTILCQNFKRDLTRVFIIHTARRNLCRDGATVYCGFETRKLAAASVQVTVAVCTALSGRLDRIPGVGFVDTTPIRARGVGSNFLLNLHVL
jgi:hypothetical protein